MAKKEEHAWMVATKLDDFCQLDWNIVDLLVVKEIICGFQDSNVGSVLHGKQISLNFVAIDKIFKLPGKGIVILIRETYNEEWVEYFEGRKDKHYKQDSTYTLAKVCAFTMKM